MEAQKRLGKERAVAAFDEKVIYLAESFYETDFDKHFWNDLNDEEKFDYIARACRKLGWSDHAFRIHRHTLQISAEEAKQIAEQLDEMQKPKNDGRGVCCVDYIVKYIRWNDIAGAIAICWNESDKIRGYNDIREFLRSTLMKDTGWEDPIVLPKEDPE